MAIFGELVDDCSKEKKMDERPDREGPGGWGDVGFLARVPRLGRPSDGVNVRTQEQEVDDNVSYLGRGA